MVLVAHSESSLQKFLGSFSASCKSFVLTISFKKTAIMFSGVEEPGPALQFLPPQAMKKTATADGRRETLPPWPAGQRSYQQIDAAAETLPPQASAWNASAWSRPGKNQCLTFWKVNCLASLTAFATWGFMISRNLDLQIELTESEKQPSILGCYRNVHGITARY